MAVRGVPQTIPELLSEARGLHVEGRIAEAANLYQHILEREPTNLNALHLYGVLSLQAGQVPQATELRAALLRARHVYVIGRDTG